MFTTDNLYKSSAKNVTHLKLSIPEVRNFHEKFQFRKTESVENEADLIIDCVWKS